MKKGKGNPHFYCEHCGAEVRRNAESCPSCGRRFSSVRCPKCDFTSDESSFSNGCPNCGYSAHFDEWEGFLPRNTAQTFQRNGPLPLWVYLVTIAAFFTVAGMFFLHLAR
ncbi:MAG: zinc ribbon domain-containing protein [Treponema sp.]|nr:zinc ribbon domain-containing protein [Treponema sp.]